MAETETAKAKAKTDKKPPKQWYTWQPESPVTKSKSRAKTTAKSKPTAAKPKAKASTKSRASPKEVAAELTEELKNSSTRGRGAGVAVVELVAVDVTAKQTLRTKEKLRNIHGQCVQGLGLQLELDGL